MINKDFSDYEKISVATDIVVLSNAIKPALRAKDSDTYVLRVLLIKRDIEPFKGKWSLPGGFMDADKTADEAVTNKLALKTGVENYYKEQLYTYTDMDRDPRGRVISIGYIALVDKEDIDISHGKNEAKWFDIAIHHDEKHNVENVDIVNEDGSKVELAFDHQRIITDAIKRLAGKILYTDIAFYMVPAEFKLGGLQNIYNSLLGYNFQAFRRFIADKVEETGHIETSTGHRPSKFYRKKKEERTDI